MILILKTLVSGYTRKDGVVVSPYHRADRFAEKKHRGQFRKDGKTPYIAHPRAVASILRDEAGITDPDTLIAAVLHDGRVLRPLVTRHAVCNGGRGGGRLRRDSGRSRRNRGIDRSLPCSVAGRTFGSPACTRGAYVNEGRAGACSAARPSHFALLTSGLLRF